MSDDVSFSFDASGIPAFEADPAHSDVHCRHRGENGLGAESDLGAEKIRFKRMVEFFL